MNWQISRKVSQANTITLALEYLVDRPCSQMGFFLGLLSSGQKFHFCSADSCYLHKLACLSRNLLNEQEITKNMDQYKRTARLSAKLTQRRLIKILRSGLPFVHFCIDQQSVDAQTLLHVYQWTIKECTVA